MKAKHLLSSACLGALCVLPVFSARADLMAVEAESGTLGSNYIRQTNASVVYITLTTDTVNVSFPGNDNRVATYNVTFPSAGTYNLFARVRVGPAGASDDSLFYANSFGVKSSTTATGWILINNLSVGGFINPGDVVTGVGTVSANSVWKWLNLSQLTNGGGSTPVTFTVPAGSLTQTFQIGGRENGFDIDKIAFGTSANIFTVSNLDNAEGGTPPPPPPPPMPKDMVSGNLIQYDDNGCWTWYSDERTVIDTNAGKMVVGCVENGAGIGGLARDGNINATIFDLPSRQGSKSTLKFSLVSFGGGDDHNAPALLVLPNGNYLAMFTGHNADSNTFYSVYDAVSKTWTSNLVYDWGVQPGGDNFNTTYSNPQYLSSENRTYDFSRGCGKSPNFIYSTDNGLTWTYGGELTTNADTGYVNGYFKYWGNGVDRVDFICTEYHPRDFDTSIYHGYVSNHMSFKTDGTLRDSNIYDKLNLPTPQSFTPVFTAGTVMPPGQTNHRCWNEDLCRYPDGTIQCMVSSRINDNTSGNDDNISPLHALFFCRYDGTNWTPTYLCQAGAKLYSSEADYVGLGCLSPNDPNTIYIATKFDPRAVIPGVHDTNLAVSASHEIWRGVTTNHGASFTWTPITQNSDRENFRPIVPAWDANHTALLWFRGTYTSAQILDMAVVGLIDDHGEVVAPLTYVDATTNNTTLANGSALVLSASANQWHLQTNGGNDGTIFSSGDSVAENAPTLATQVSFPAAGTYDVWVNFWGLPASDWRILSGLSADGMQLFRQMASKEVQPGDHTTSLVLTNSTGAYLYQAYLGRVTNSSGCSVFVDDYNLQTGTTNTAVGNTTRTWYDGVSFARVDGFQLQNVARDNTASSVTLTWNSVAPEATLTAPTYTVLKKNSLSDSTWTMLVTGLPSGGSTTSYVDNSASGNSAFYRVTRP